jgi:hypothetical protein
MELLERYMGLLAFELGNLYIDLEEGVYIYLGIDKVNHNQLGYYIGKMLLDWSKYPDELKGQWRVSEVMMLKYAREILKEPLIPERVQKMNRNGNRSIVGNMGAVCTEEEMCRWYAKQKLLGLAVPNLVLKDDGLGCIYQRGDAERFCILIAKEEEGYVWFDVEDVKDFYIRPIEYMQEHMSQFHITKNMRTDVKRLSEKVSDAILQQAYNLEWLRRKKFK